MCVQNTSCSVGHYCPLGTSLPSENPCPAGTFSDQIDDSRVEDCVFCPAAQACGWGTGGSSNPPQSCAAGHYCPQGTQHPEQYPCPAGSYSPRTNLVASAECETCAER